MLQNIHTLPRRKKQVLMLFFDVVAIIASLFLAFFLRLGYWFYPSGDLDLLIVIFASPILAVPIFIRFGLYREVTRYVGFNVLWKISKAVSIYAILWGLLTFMAAIEFIPRSVILINLLILTGLISGSRLLVRRLLASQNKNHNVIIYGAGEAGRQLCNALSESKEYKPVAFIDEENQISSHSINGVKVYSENDIEYLINHKDIREVFLAVPQISRKRHREIIENFQSFSLIVRSLPAFTDLAKGAVTVNDLLEIDIKDLLGRELVTPNEKLLKINIAQKNILVTGAGGSIGSEICRQIILFSPKRIVLYEISESSIYQIDQELKNKGFENIEIYPIIGSVLDRDRLINICNSYNIETIYHAAAYKHVPLVELNKSQGVINNAIGTLYAAQAAIIAQVETFVLISTDKAVRPTNVMGASKRIAELVLQALALESHKTCFTMVRFGNVLDSSGSVIPLFKKQIKAGGPLTVTHSNIVRYFMTIPEAVELVIQSGAMAKGGEVFVLDMGDPVRINDLAIKMIQLSGLQVRDEANPDGDIEIKYTGLRPGEKLYEELLIDGEFSTTSHKLIMKAKEDMIEWTKLEPMLDAIKKAALKSDSESLDDLLFKIVPQYKSNK
jgi:FlaA1/EpsC-like NDP-sugar epimerase